MTKAEFVDKLAEKGKITKKHGFGSHRADLFNLIGCVGRW